MQLVPSGISLPFEYTDAGGSSTLDVAMKVYDTSSGSAVLVSTVAMVHVINGTYIGYFTPAAAKSYLINKMVYTNNTYATPSNRYSAGSESVYTDKLNTDVLTRLGTPAGADVSADIAAVKSDTGTLTTRLTATRAGNLDNLDATVSSRATQASVDSIQNNTSFIGVVPPVLVLPDAGSKTYKFYARLFDDVGNPEDPDTLTLNIRIELFDGTVIVATTAMTRTGVGKYEYSYVVNSTDTEQPLAVFFEYSENSVSFQQVRSTEVQEFETKLDTLLGRLTSTRASNLDNLDAPVSTVQSDVTAIKAKTDQITFDSGRVVSKAEVVTDKTGYALTSGEKDDIVDRVWDESAAAHVTAGSFGSNLDTPVSTRESETNAASRASSDQSEHDATQAAIAALPSVAQISDGVWDEPLAGHAAVGSTGEALSAAATSIASPSSIASAVWDSLLSAHTAPGTFGLVFDVIRQYVTDNNNILTNGTYGPQALRALILTVNSNLVTEINQNETKIDSIIPAVNAARDAVIAEVDAVDISVGNLAAQLTTAEGNIIVQINQNETKIDSLGSQIGTIQNNTTTRFIVPSEVYKPEVGSKDYEFHLRLYDTNGNPEAPDSAPTIRIRRLDTSVDIVSGAVMPQLGANVGAYYYTFTVTAGSALYPFLVEATVVEGGVTRLVPAVSEIVEFQSDLDAIQTAVAALDVKTSDVQSKVNNATFGLSALKTGQTNIISEVNQNETKIDAVKAKTDLIPADPATETTVNAVGAAVLTRPTLAQIITQLNLVRDAIKGPDNRDNTEVYDHFDISSVAKTSDPRFAFLDAAVSSRSTLTAAQVWAHATRTLTSVTLSPTEVAKVWDYLTSSSVTAGSFGKLIKDNLDAKVSTRATQAQLASLLTGVAQESTVSGGFGSTASTLAAMTATLTAIQNLATLVKAKTDNLPASPANETTLQTETAQIDTAISNLSALVNLVKTKTDNLPAQPAQQGSVLAIPTNPVLSTDARLNRLDVNVSTRSTLTTADLVNLASDADLIAATNTVLTQLATILTGVNSANTAIVQRPTDSQMNAKFAPVAKTSELISVESDILDAIANIPSGGGGGATPAQIWAYATRTLTASPTDISNLATAAQVAALGGATYTCRMSTVFKNGPGTQEIIAWAEKNGQRETSATNCVVAVKNALGATIWTANLASPNADGVFRFSNAIVVGADENYYVVIEAVVDAVVRRSQQPFFTVG